MTTVKGTVGGDSWHEALLFGGDDEFVSGTAPFVREGLERGEAVAVAVPPAHLSLLRDVLEDVVQEVQWFDMAEEGRNPSRIMPAVIASFADRRPGPVRFVGEPVWPARSADEYVACVEHEALVNSAFMGRDLRIRCPYDRSGLKPAMLAEAAVTHPVLVEGGVRRSSPDYAPEGLRATYNLPLPAPPDVDALVFDVDGLSHARQFAITRAVAWGVGAERSDDLALIVGELCGNSVQHGGGSGTLRTWPDGDHVVCQVEDAGFVTDPLAGRLPAAPSQTGGRGLLLVNHLADLVRCHTSTYGTATRVHLRRDHRPGGTV